MTHGIFLARSMRPQSKKSIKRALTEHEPVYLEDTSLFMDGYSGSVYTAPAGVYFFVGPHPYNRKFTGQIISDGKGNVKIK